MIREQRDRMDHLTQHLNKKSDSEKREFEVTEPVPEMGLELRSPDFLGRASLTTQISFSGKDSAGARDTRKRRGWKEPVKERERKPLPGAP